jgi:hypothetical protein
VGIHQNTALHFPRAGHPGYSAILHPHRQGHKERLWSRPSVDLCEFPGQEGHILAHLCLILGQSACPGLTPPLTPSKSSRTPASRSILPTGVEWHLFATFIGLFLSVYGFDISLRTFKHLDFFPILSLFYFCHFSVLCSLIFYVKFLAG